MADLRIPKRFQILGQTIEVVWDVELNHKNDWNGSAVYRKNQIRIQPNGDGTPRTQDQIGHTFCHELMHWILYYAAAFYPSSKEHLHQDEGLVDLAGGLLHQALTSMEYEGGA
ncbi:MAG: hypothetical protein PHS14_14240 [Elusimicrobia bacterium]|nr:hypothetical protein [Elusimicrobiota bacterium]